MKYFYEGKPIWLVPSGMGGVFEAVATGEEVSINGVRHLSYRVISPGWEKWEESGNLHIRQHTPDQVKLKTPLPTLGVIGKKRKVKYATAKRLDQLGIDLSQYPNAGPNANAPGMREVWGHHAFIVKHSAYLYCVEWHVWESI